MMNTNTRRSIFSFVIVLLLSGIPVMSGNSQPMETVLSSQDLNLQKRIFLDLRDINVVDVLKFLAIEGGLNIVTSKNVQGRSTLVLKDVAIRDALDIIVVSNRLAYEMRNDIIYVMTEDEYRELYGENYNDKRDINTRILKYAKPSYVLSALQSLQSSIGRIIIEEDTGSVIMIDTADKLEKMNALLDRIERKMDSKVVTLQYAVAKDVELALRSQLDAKSVGTILADERSNSLIINAYPGRMEGVLKLIKELDKKTAAVLVEVRIVQVSINPKYDYGIDWETSFSQSQNKILDKLSFRNAFDISSTVSSDTNLGSVGKIAAGRIPIDQFEGEIRLLKQVQETKVLANPRLMITNREEATINIGDRIPYVVTTTTGTGNNVSISEEILFIDVGLQLKVTPIINDDGVITMKIRPEISSRTGTLTTPAGAAVPLVNTTFAETNIVVSDGVTVILGGLRRDDMVIDHKGIPYLMDIPLVGELFKSRSDSLQKTEIVIFITPKIVDGETNVTDDPIMIKPNKLVNP